MARSGTPFSLLSKTKTPNGSLINRSHDIPSAINREALGRSRFRLAPGASAEAIQPAPGTLGRNTELAPSYVDFHVTLQKSFTLTESASIQIRAEAFNLLNRVNHD